jgi:hypothetical protein
MGVEQVGDSSWSTAAGQQQLVNSNLSTAAERQHVGGYRIRATAATEVKK